MENQNTLEEHHKLILEQWEAYIKTPEYEADISEWLRVEEERRFIADSQLERFHVKFSDSFGNVVDKIIIKYDSDKYRLSWYKRGIEPPTPLFWFLLSYAKRYGRECTDAEIEKHGNMFMSSLYYYKGYYFMRMDGQGSVVHVIKENNET